jgi:hypothetical protein
MIMIIFSDEEINIKLIAAINMIICINMSI